jgi:hypothetical protein
MPVADAPKSNPARSDLIAGEIDDAALDTVMQAVPRGALALSGIAVGLLLLAWFLVYALVFLPRGMVG